jgi:hypothetical protein
LKGARIRSQPQRPIDTVRSWRKEGRDNSDAKIDYTNQLCSQIYQQTLFSLRKVMGKTTERSTRELPSLKIKGVFLSTIHYSDTKSNNEPKLC